MGDAEWVRGPGGGFGRSHDVTMEEGDGQLSSANAHIELKRHVEKHQMHYVNAACDCSVVSAETRCCDRDRK